jgi:RNA polymerase sigma-70 factor (ECF subfamily)
MDIMESTMSSLSIPLLPIALRSRNGELGTSPERAEAALRDFLTSAQKSWPDFDLSISRFVSYAMERLPQNQPLDEALAGLFVADLYLACACVEQNPRALAAFDRDYLNEVHYAIARMPPTKASTDDLKQSVREKLFVGSGDAAPHIVEYKGRGDLRSFVRVIIVRLLIDLVRAERAQKREVTRNLLQREVELANPETEYFRKHYAAEFSAAFAEALQLLTPVERNLLRQQFVHRLTLEELSALYGVHRATAARWLQQVRRRLIDNTRNRLMGRLQVSASEFLSIARAIKSTLDFRVGCVLAAKDDCSGVRGPSVLGRRR